MLSKKNIQFIRSLSVKKYRQKYHKYLAEGDKICEEIISGFSSSLKMLYCVDSFYSRNAQNIEKKSIPYTVIDKKELKKISVLTSPNNCVAIMNMDLRRTIDDGKIKSVVYLDDVRDPGNLGTIIRSAEWFGVDQIVLSPNSVDPYNPKVVQAAMGSLFRVAIIQEDLSSFIGRRNEDFTIYKAEMNGQNAFSIKFSFPCVLIMGNESHGVLVQTDESKTQSISIPSFGNPTESLNVGVATSILLSEIFKQR